MEHITLWFNQEALDVVHAYLFGNVKYLDFLMILMLIDVMTGVTKAIKEKRLRSRNSYFGYARKMGVFGIVILANIMDNILALNGAVAMATVLFYIANEGLSIIENLAQIGVKVPKVISDKLHVIESDNKEGEKE